MPPRQTLPPSDPSRRDEQRPTLPPIRQLFGQELSRAVPLQRARGASTSPHLPFNRLAMADEDPRYPSRHAITPDPRALPHATHPRNASDPAYYSHAQPHAVPQPHMQYYSQGQGQQQGYYQGQSSQYASRNPIASGSYPYSASQPMMRQPVPGSSGGPAWAVADPAASERPSSSRYECSYCGKSFTRPSSLKIHIHHHTGEKPFTCPYEGCGRSFSVQSNMRRHTRVHTRPASSQAEPEDEESLEEEDQTSGSERSRDTTSRKASS